MENYSGYEIDHTPVSWSRNRAHHYSMKKENYLKLAASMEKRAKWARRRGSDKEYTKYLRLLATAAEYRRLEGLFE